MATYLDTESSPLFQASTSSTRQLFHLLNCISFAPRAEVEVGPEGIRFTVEESRSMQGVAFLDKALFSSYRYSNINSEPESSQDSASEPPSFQISLLAVLETLQIFGATDFSSRTTKPDNDYSSAFRPNHPNAFSSHTLGVTGICRLSYTGPGSPLSIIIEERGIVTTCNLHTYEPSPPWEIPFQRDQTTVKVIMQSRWLYDAISELSSTTPSRLDIIAYPQAPFLSISATGPLGSATVDFRRGRELLETFAVTEKWGQSYRFEMIKSASEAMKLATKVSLRGDEQGVLSLQFMVEVEGGVSFIDFRFVPFMLEDEDQEDEEDEETQYDDTDDD